MRKVELADSRLLNYPDLSQLLDAALVNMQQTRDTYKLLKETADYTPYNPEVIEALKNFNYDLYCETNWLNKEIFNGVKSYLINGRVTETYGKRGRWVRLCECGDIIGILDKSVLFRSESCLSP